MKSDLVVLVPGTESTAEVTFSGLAPLLKRDYEVELFNFHSPEDESAHNVFASYVTQLNTILRQASDRKIHLLGYSLGAHIALRAATTNPNVSSLCLVAGWLRTDSFQAERHALWLDLYEHDPTLAGRLSHLVQYSSTYRSFLAEQHTATVLASGIPDDEIRTRVQVNQIIDSTEAALSLNIPALVIYGNADSKVPEEHAFELYGALAQATLVQTTGGHALLRERLGQVYGTYEDFLSGKLAPGVLADTLIP